MCGKMGSTLFFFIFSWDRPLVKFGDLKQKLKIMIEFLKERAKEFFEEAEELLKKKRYNLSAFNLEQAIQLWIKS